MGSGPAWLVDINPVLVCCEIKLPGRIELAQPRASVGSQGSYIVPLRKDREIVPRTRCPREAVLGVALFGVKPHAGGCVGFLELHPLNHPLNIFIFLVIILIVAVKLHVTAVWC